MKPNRKERAKTHSEKMKIDKKEVDLSEKRLRKYNVNLGVFESEQARKKTNEKTYWVSPQRYL